MTQHILFVLGSFILSAMCGFAFIPMIMNFCKKKGLYDLPDSRKVHKNAIPRLGGVSFMPSMLLSSLIVIVVYNQQLFSKQILVSPWSIGFFVSLLIIYSVGIIDDLVGLGARSKFTAQILAAIILVLTGLYINNLYGLCDIYAIPYYIGAPLTVLIIVFISNAINLIDGIDGLSAGLSLLALTGFLICFMNESNMLAYCILIAGLMGVLVSFLYFNIFGKAEKNRKIFMGDSGSLTLGFILGFLFVKFSMNEPELRCIVKRDMILAYSLLVVPTFDVVRVTLIRLWHRKHVFQADKNHIHHKLMRAGLSQHQTLLGVLGLAIAFLMLNLALNYMVDISTIFIIDIVAWMAFHEVINCFIRKRHLPVFQCNEDLK